MKYEINRHFEKDLRNLPEAAEKAAGEFLIELEGAKTLRDVRDCIPFQGKKNAYRVRRGNYRILIILYVENEVVHLMRMLTRGQAYKKNV